MKQIVWLFVALAVLPTLFFGCAGVKIATKSGDKRLPLEEVSVRFKNPYEYTLLITDIEPKAVLFPDKIIVSPTGSAEVKIKVFLGKVYTIRGHAVRGNEITRFRTQFSTAELSVDASGAVRVPVITLRFSNEQQGVVLNLSGRTIPVMTIDVQGGIVYKNIPANGVVDVSAAPPGFVIVVYFQDEDSPNYYRMRRIPIIVHEGQRLVDFRGTQVSIKADITPEDYLQYNSDCRVRKDQIAF